MVLAALSDLNVDRPGLREQNGLEIVLCPDTGDAGEEATKKLTNRFHWSVADMDGIPDGDCPLDMDDWLARIDARTPWAPEQTEDDANSWGSTREKEPEGCFGGTEIGETGSENEKQWHPRSKDRLRDDPTVFTGDEGSVGFDDGTHEGETPSSERTPDPDQETPVVPRNDVPSPESFPREEWGWAYT